MKRLLIALVGFSPLFAAAAATSSVLVRTEPLRRHAIAETLVGYGTLAPDVGGTINLNLPRPGRITALEVSPGRGGQEGRQAARRSAPPPPRRSSFRQAENALAFARSELARSEQLLAQKLATASQLAAARKALADAEAALAAQRRLGTGTATEPVKAPFDGVVVSIGAALGDRIAAGTAVLKLARLSGLRVLLGIEPSDSFAVRAGMPVHLTPVFDAERSVDAKVAAVHGMVDPQTQLVNVVVRIDSGNLLPGMRVKGEITLASRTGWAVPRSAVLRDGNGDYLFQVKRRRRQARRGAGRERRRQAARDQRRGPRPGAQGGGAGQLRAVRRHGGARGGAMNFTQWVQAHRRSILFLLAMLALAGAFAAFKLPVTLFPKVDFPRVLVSLEAGDRPADLMALQVTVPVEEAVRRVPGVRDVRSTTSRGSADVSINFDWGTDMAAATSQVNGAISQILPGLPPGTQLRVKRMDPTVFPILAYSLTSDSQSLSRAVRPRALPAAPAAVEHQRRGAHPGGRRRARGIPRDGRPGAARGLRARAVRRLRGAERGQRGDRGRQARRPLQALSRGVRHAAAEPGADRPHRAAAAAPTAWCG